MNPAAPAKPVERLFPFVLRARNLLVGRETLLRSKSKLQFVLITLDLSEKSRAEVLSQFGHYPVVQHYTSEELTKFFGLNGTKVLGFQKSGLAKSIYAELKQYRLNKPAPPASLPATKAAEHPGAPGATEPSSPPGPNPKSESQNPKQIQIS
jgi:hypothetical protein